LLFATTAYPETYGLNLAILAKTNSTSNDSIDLQLGISVLQTTLQRPLRY